MYFPVLKSLHWSNWLFFSIDIFNCKLFNMAFYATVHICISHIDLFMKFIDIELFCFLRVFFYFILFLNHL